MRQTLLTIFLVVAILATGFVWFRYIRTAPVPEPPAAPGEASERLGQYRQLKNLKPDIGIVSDPLFQSLKAAVSVPPGSPPSPAITIGRPNPFAPF